MTKRKKAFLKGLATLVGTTIGAGIFGVPYAFAKVGFLVGLLYIVIIGFALMMVNLLYGEICLRCTGKIRLVGQTGIYLNPWWHRVSGVFAVFSFWVSILAYIIIGGEFLNVIFGKLWIHDPFAYSIIFFIGISIIIYRGIHSISKVEVPMLVLLGITMAAIVISATPYIDIANLMTVDLSNFFLPFGVVLFALGASSAIPEVEDVMVNKKDFKKVIIFGNLIALALTILFAVTIIGVSGVHTSQDAISGLVGKLGGSVVVLGAVFGFLAIATSFLVIGDNLKGVFHYDYKLDKRVAWALSLGVPFIIFISANPDFINVVSIAGGLFGSFVVIIIAMMALEMRRKRLPRQREPEYKVPYYKVWAYGLIGVFLLGMLYQIYFIFQ